MLLCHILILSKHGWLTINLDIAYISDWKNIQYFTGFGSDPFERTLALFIFPDKDPFIFAPALEVEAIKKAGWKYPVYGYLDMKILML